MTKNLDSEGLCSIANNYDLFYIDLWGVVHNGVELHDNAIIALKKILELNKKFVLLTNAPRPINTVKLTLEKMGMDENLRNHVFTSGEASLSYLEKEHKSQKFYHIGPPRDFDLFRDFKNYKSSKIDECEYLLCTGLFDDYDQDLNYYKDLLENHIDKK
jgi:ribonucleotide monophosphatase NagD (HAD superfamily)